MTHIPHTFALWFCTGVCIHLYATQSACLLLLFTVSFYILKLKKSKKKQKNIICYYLEVPEHICPTVNLADKAVMVDGDVFVGLVDIEGRGHEVMCDE